MWQDDGEMKRCSYNTFTRSKEHFRVEKRRRHQAQGTEYQAPVTPGTTHQAAVARHKAPGSRHQVPGNGNGGVVV